MVFTENVTVCPYTLRTVLVEILVLSHVSPYIQTLGDRIVNQRTQEVDRVIVDPYDVCATHDFII